MPKVTCNCDISKFGKGGYSNIRRKFGRVVGAGTSVSAQMWFKEIDITEYDKLLAEEG